LTWTGIPPKQLGSLCKSRFSEAIDELSPFLPLS
jgi:hypothetical protein